MFDFDAGKLLIIGVIALIVIGPKELPRVLRQVGQFVGRMRRMATEFQGQFMDAMKEADIQSIREEVEKINKESAFDVRFDPARDIQSELTRSLETPHATAASAAIEVDPATHSPAETFTLPAPEATAAALAEEAAAGGAPESGTLAAAGIAPVVEGPSETGPPASEDAPERPRKRKIVLLKRRPLRMNGPHEVCDRTAARRGRTAGASR